MVVSRPLAHSWQEGGRRPWWLADHDPIVGKRMASNQGGKLTMGQQLARERQVADEAEPTAGRLVGLRAARFANIGWQVLGPTLGSNPSGQPYDRWPTVGPTVVCSLGIYFWGLHHLVFFHQPMTCSLK